MQLAELVVTNNWENVSFERRLKLFAAVFPIHSFDLFVKKVLERFLICFILSDALQFRYSFVIDFDLMSIPFRASDRIRVASSRASLSPSRPSPSP